jgi:hypothetical protein
MDVVQKDDEAQTPTISRRGFFGRTVGLAGAAGVLLALTGCPAGDGGDDDDDDDGGDPRVERRYIRAGQGRYRGCRSTRWT